MKTVSMSGSQRENVGKKDAKKLRKQDQVPCVLYGGDEQIHFSTDERNFTKLLFTPETFFIKLDIGGKEYNCILKDVQYHPVSDKVLHADFMEYDEDKPITVHVPIKLTGNAPGVISGGVLVQKFRKLFVNALPADMPENIEIDINDMEIHDNIHVRDLVENKFQIMEKGERFVVGVQTTRLAAVTELVEEGEEVEGEEVEGETPAEGAAPAAEEKADKE